MANLTFNGITIPGASESLKEAPDFVGDVNDRVASAEHVENYVARKRKWTCKVIAQTAAKSVAMRRYLEGEGQSWSFDSTMYSGKGEGPASGGGYTRSGTSGVHGGKVNVSSGDVLEFALAYALGQPGGWVPTKGWTLMVWKQLSVGDGGDGSAYYHHIATGSVAVTRGSSANPASVTQYRNGVAGSYSMGNWIDVASDGDVGIYGKSNANTSAAYDYDDLVFLPFVLDSSWVTGLYTYLASYAHPALKRVMLSGDQIEDAAPGVEVHIRATEIPRKRRVFSGSSTSAARELQLTITEV